MMDLLERFSRLPENPSLTQRVGTVAVSPEVQCPQVLRDLSALVAQNVGPQAIRPAVEAPK